MSTEHGRCGPRTILNHKHSFKFESLNQIDQEIEKLKCEREVALQREQERVEKEKEGQQELLVSRRY